MTPYQALRTAVQRHNGIATAFEVRRELTVYIASLRRPHKPLEVYTRAEYHALVNRRKKRKPKRKKGEADPVMFVYESIEDGRQEVRGHHVKLDEEHVEDMDWIDAFAKRQQEECDADSYAGEW